MTKLLYSLTLVSALILSAACDVVNVAAQTQTGTFDRTLQVKGPVTLDVRTGSGDIQIRTGSGETVHIIGRIRASSRFLNDSLAANISEIEKNPPIEQAGAMVRIGPTGDNPLYRNISISYEITVPANAEIRSSSGSGNQQIGSVRGSVTAHSGSGNIAIGEATGDVRARTGSGDIDIERAGGLVDATAGSGSIHARAVAGAIRAQTGSGDVEMTQIARGDADVRTGSGDVRLDLADNAGFDFTGRTGSGSIQIAQPITIRTQSRNRLEGSVGGGGATVNVMTGSGSITIR
jgi:putative adhesin